MVEYLMINSFARWSGLCLLAFLSAITQAQEPPGYYNSAAGLSGQELRSALFNIIKDHNAQSYSSLWSHFLETDRKENGYVWDMYSDVPGGNPAYNYTFITDQCGNYSAEGDCYNREHSFPQSWFNSEPPMVTDLFHIYPTDGYVNGKRGNYSYGEVISASWISTNGSKVGDNTFPGYLGTVFEPVDDYKGDFARTYFYMMTRYMDQVSSWDSDMLNGGDLASWASNMLMEWNADDPVSVKEINRNNAVFTIQENRNPFIDHPEWVEDIWGIPSAIAGMESPDPNLSWDGRHLCVSQQENAVQGILAVYSIHGQILAQTEIAESQACLTVVLSAGIYFGQFTHSKGVTFIKFITSGR